MMRALLFRLAAPNDAAHVRAISAEAYIPAYLAVTGAVPKPAFENYSDRIEEQNVWLAEIEGETCGVLVLAPASDHLMIYSIAVRPDRQRTGLGRALLAFAQDRAKEMKIPELRLYTNRRMLGNRAFYRACGFVEVGARPHPSRSGEFLVDMVKSLTARTAR